MEPENEADNLGNNQSYQNDCVDKADVINTLHIPLQNSLNELSEQFYTITQPKVNLLKASVDEITLPLTFQP